MAQPTLADIGALDLSRIIHDKQMIRRYCKQRGRMEMLDGIVHEDHATGVVIGFQDLGHDAWWTEDHIPGRPIFPGVLQAEGAAQVCTFDFLRRNPALEEKFLGFAGLNDARFRAIVAPGVRMHWIAKLHRVRSSMFTYRTEGFVGKDVVFEAEVMGIVI